MAYNIQSVDIKGKKIKKISLSDNVFDDSLINEGLIHEYVVMYLANRRQSSANTKTRGEVKTSGRKLYNQKGGGRARVGDAGSPIRRSGGVAMGPRKERKRSKRMPQKMKIKALCGALTLKARADRVFMLDKYMGKEIKTKEAYAVLKNIGLGGLKTLLVLDAHDAVIEKSFKNIDGIKYVTSLMLNAYDVMSYKNILFVEKSSLLVLESRVLKNKSH